MSRARRARNAESLQVLAACPGRCTTTSPPLQIPISSLTTNLQMRDLDSSDR
jgi:hypothetical protein